jgi:Leucine-rich repeat (LRR) protein
MKLDLSSNNISSVRGLKLDGLIHLSEINLSNNKLISLPPNSFSTSGMLR